MIKINTLIADNDIEFIKYIINIFNKIDNINISSITTDGKETLETIKKNYFNLIILDSQIPNVNESEILGNICNQKKHDSMPKTIIVSKKTNSLKNIIKYPTVVGIINKTSNSNVLFNKIKSITDEISFNKIERNIIKQLNLLGYNFKYKGTHYIYEAILYIYISRNSKLLENLENNVYKDIAIKNNKSLLNIKTSIIKATNYMYLYQNSNTIEKYFSFTYKPTPKTVISTVLMKLGCLYS